MVGPTREEWLVAVVLDDDGVDDIAEQAVFDLIHIVSEPSGDLLDVLLRKVAKRASKQLIEGAIKREKGLMERAGLSRLHRDGGAGASDDACFVRLYPDGAEVLGGADRFHACLLCVCRMSNELQSSYPSG